MKPARVLRSYSCTRLRLQKILRILRAPNRLSFSIFTCTSHFKLLKVYITRASTEKLIKGDWLTAKGSLEIFKMLVLQLINTTLTE